MDEFLKMVINDEEKHHQEHHNTESALRARVAELEAALKAIYDAMTDEDAYIKDGDIADIAAAALKGTPHAPG